MQTNEIGDLCFKLGFAGVVENRVIAFGNAQGEKSCLRILRKIKNECDKRKEEGLDPEPAKRLWEKYSEDYVKAKRKNQHADIQKQEWEESKEAHIESKSRGYQPTREAIKAQLDELYQDSKISITEYNLGIKGLQFVHTLVEQAQELPDEVREPGSSVNPVNPDGIEMDEELAAMMVAG